MFSLILVIAVLALLPVIVPFKVWRRYAVWLRLQPDGQGKELAKASHGAGFLALSGLLVLLAQSQGGSVSSQPLLWVPLAVMAAWGALWLVTSGLAARRYGSQGPLDTVVLVRSLVKIAVGCTVVHFRPADAGQLLRVALNATDWQLALFALAWLAAWFAAMWCIVTGAAKVLLLLLTKIRRRARQAPQPVTNPRGDARDASRAEARRAMQGQGGVASPLDKQEF
jgi:hypothetical protein